MINKIKERLKEPSTYAGLSSLTLGLGYIFKIDEAPQIATVIQTAGQSATQADASWLSLVLGVVFGLVSVFKSDKK